MVQHKHINRREGIALFAGVGALTLAPVTAAAFHSSSSAHEWDAAFAEYRDAKRALDAFDAVHSRIMNQCRAALAKIPHTTLRPDPYCGRAQPVTTADRDYVMSARYVVRELDAGRRHHDPIPSLQKHTQLLRDTVAADNEREAARQAVRDQFSMDDADDKLDALADQLSDAQSALMSLPAPTRSALLWKLEHILELDHESTASWSAEYVKQTKADMRRLLTGEA